MLKKLFFSLIAIVGVAFATSAKDIYTHDASVLPKAAQTVLKNNFKSKVSVVKIEKDFGRVSEYEVVMTDGSEITFDRDGNWKDVEVALNGKIPASFIPTTISNFVKNNQKGMDIVGIEKDRKGYEVELSNGVEMKFNTQGMFLKYD